jgi:hypothetical protein
MAKTSTSSSVDLGFDSQQVGYSDGIVYVILIPLIQFLDSKINEMLH